MSLRLPVYLDYASTTPMDEEVLAAMMPYFTTNYGNASSKSHAFGWFSNDAVEMARESIASFIHCIKEELVFTSGATESINLALRGLTDPCQAKKNHIIAFADEHRAVLETFFALEKKGYRITILPVNENGAISLSDLSDAITDNTLLISCMYANNETGVIHPIREVGALAKEKKVFFFCDATQAFGKIPINVEADNIDLMAFSAHKIYGPKGTGALYIRRKNPRVMLTAQITGGAQERQLRSGTLNIPAIAGFGKAVELCKSRMEADALHITALRMQLEKTGYESFNITIQGAASNRLPNIINMTLHDYAGSGLIPALCTQIAVSSGSACSSGNTEGSHVLKAMGLSKEAMKKTVRISLGRMTRKEDVEKAIEAIRLICN
jgi:cysteine desulfurase